MNLRNAFSLNEDELPAAERETLIQSLAEFVVKRGLSVPAILALDMHRPLAHTMGAGVVVMTPILGPLFGLARMEQAKSLLTSRDGVECLIQRIEELTVLKSGGLNDVSRGEAPSYMNHATRPAGVILIVISAVIVWTVIAAQRGKKLFIRRIPGLTAIDEAVGRAVEMGRGILLSSGLGGIDVVTLQALAICTNIASAAARYGTKVQMPIYEAALLPIAEDAISSAYNKAGRSDAFSSDDVRYLSNQQFAYAAGVAGMIQREQYAATFLFGTFFAESLIMAENANMVGAIQVAGTPSTTQIPFFIASCDYVIIGDEYYAATAYLTRQPTLLGSMIGQDRVKIAILVTVMLGFLLTMVKLPLVKNLFEDKDMPAASYYSPAKGGK
jgi:hypothetical protein